MELKACIQARRCSSRLYLSAVFSPECNSDQKRHDLFSSVLVEAKAALVFELERHDYFECDAFRFFISNTHIKYEIF